MLVVSSNLGFTEDVLGVSLVARQSEPPKRSDQKPTHYYPMRRSQLITIYRRKQSQQPSSQAVLSMVCPWSSPTC